jgi:hypothetical protein
MWGFLYLDQRWLPLNFISNHNAPKRFTALGRLFIRQMALQSESQEEGISVATVSGILVGVGVAVGAVVDVGTVVDVAALVVGVLVYDSSAAVVIRCQKKRSNGDGLEGGDGHSGGCSQRPSLRTPQREGYRSVLL